MWLAMFGQETAPGTPVEWLNFGTAGLVVVSFLLGWIWPRPAVDRLVKENESLRDEILAEVRAISKELGREAP